MASSVPTSPPPIGPNEAPPPYGFNSPPSEPAKPHQPAYNYQQPYPHYDQQPYQNQQQPYQNQQQPYQNQQPPYPQYQQPPPVVYQQPPPVPQVTNQVVVVTGGAGPHVVRCGNCGVASSHARIKMGPSLMTHACALAMCLAFPFCFLPYCCNCCYTSTEYCISCDAVL